MSIETQLAQAVRDAMQPMLTEVLERIEERLAAVQVPQPPELMSQGDVAKYLRVVPRTVARMRERGELPEPVRIGGCVRWVRAELEAWVRGGGDPAGCRSGATRAGGRGGRPARPRRAQTDGATP